MAETTGQLDKLLSDKIDEKIRVFGQYLTEQISQFLKDNEDYSGDHLYMVNGGTVNEPNFSYESLAIFKRNMIKGISKQVKDKMILKETKALLKKLELLS
jgi:hypothetical protein